MKELKERMKNYANEKGVEYTDLVNESVYEMNAEFSEEIVLIACENLGINAEDCDFGEEYMNELEKIANNLIA